MATILPPEARKALVIAISEYDFLDPLSYCKKDGEDVLMVLAQVKYIIKDNNKQIGAVTFEDLRNAIIDFFSDPDVKASDTLFFYFSGHGITDARGDLYLAASNLDPNSTYYKNGFSFRDVSRIMYSSQARKIVVALDCCYSGSAKLTRNDSSLYVYGLEQGLRELEDSEGKCLLAASMSTQEAQKLKDYENSLFTHYLIKGLKGDNDSVDHDGNVTAESLGKFIYKSIQDQTGQDKPKQVPIRKIFGGADIVLATHTHLAKPKGGDLLVLLKDGKLNDFNKIREEHHYVYLDLRDRNLGELNLSEVNFQGADLRGADLSHSNLKDANLRMAKLNYANLSGTDMTRADLSNADLTDADLMGAVLDSARLKGAILLGTNLRSASLQQANLTDADLRGAALRDAKMVKADLTQANLFKTNLVGSDLTQANLTRSTLRRADLRHATMFGAELNETDLRFSEHLPISKDVAKEEGAFV